MYSKEISVWQLVISRMENLAFMLAQIKDDLTINSHYITHTFILKWLGEFVL